ncbi:DUF2589 domain-containing protein [Gloeothece verrucosa]|uniref:Uncharacterized protein n=1 Tax=Gloeothece verrucosa (strain PCC 7822) TaxID=497965 RepID=E0UFV1_GLOV7|nr:DUF2589 domain-containing protein [Gloeothece verrucosa]ADN14334.1 hypothetical protein Cyan7822_2356 [Gloeothece verrucosa PCC 7822]
MNLRRIVRRVIREIGKAIAQANAVSHSISQRPDLMMTTSSVRYTNLKRLDLRLPRGLATVHQEWKLGNRVMLTVVPDDYFDSGRSGYQSPRYSGICDLHQFLGGILASLVRGEAIAAKEMINYVLEVGGDQNNGLTKLRMVTFEYEKIEPKGRKFRQIVQIPLLSLMPIPMIRIKDAQLNFDLEIVRGKRESRVRSKTEPNLQQTQSHPSMTEETETDQNIRENYEDELQLQVILPMTGHPPTDLQSPHTGLSEGEQNTVDTDQIPVYESLRVGVQVTVERSDMPEGISRLLSLVNDNISFVSQPLNNQNQSGD